MGKGSSEGGPPCLILACGWSIANLSETLPFLAASGPSYPQPWGRLQSTPHFRTNCNCNCTLPHAAQICQQSTWFNSGRFNSTTPLFESGYQEVAGVYPDRAAGSQSRWRGSELPRLGVVHRRNTSTLAPFAPRPSPRSRILPSPKRDRFPRTAHGQPSW